jgi:AcrR family transcriptional regulator
MGSRRGDVTLIPMLAAGATIADAAEAAGISERTVYRRLRDFTFVAEVDAARRIMISQTIGILTEANISAALALRELLNSEADYVKRAAAKDIIELALKMRFEFDLSERLVRVEAMLQESLSRE